MRNLLIRTAVLATGLGVAGCVVTPVNPYPAPPAPRVEVVPPAPAGTVMVWRPGYYRWTGVNYVWVPGAYVARQPGYGHWVPGRWVYRGGQWVWINGHWG